MGNHSCLFHTPDFPSGTLDGPAICPTLKIALETPDCSRAASRSLSVIHFDSLYPCAAGIDGFSNATSGTGVLGCSLTQLLRVPIEDVKKIGGNLGDSDDNLTRLIAPEICGSNDGSARLKLTCHWLSKYGQNIHYTNIDASNLRMMMLASVLRLS